MIDKPHAPATERNREAILEVLRDHLSDSLRVLEIGSGTGQHAIHFARELPQLVWQCSDQHSNLAGIRAWLREAALRNTPNPIELDVTAGWPSDGFDAVFSANTLHIMPWFAVEQFFAGLRRCLNPKGKLIIYGPFNYQGRYTSASNEHFDQSLRSTDPQRGIRDFEAVQFLAASIGLSMLEDRAMPANNRCLVWRNEGPSAQAIHP